MPAPEEQGKRSGTGDDVPPNPFVYCVLDAARPGKSIRGLQHPQLGEVLVDLEKLITQKAGCFAPRKQMSESSPDDLNGVKRSFHEGNRVPFMGEKSRRSDEGNQVPLRCPLRKSKGSGAGRGTTFPRTPLSTASWMQRAREKHPCLAASATW